MQRRYGGAEDRMRAIAVDEIARMNDGFEEVKAFPETLPDAGQTSI